MIAFVNDSGNPVVCCGELMHEVIPGAIDASIEKHVPVYSVKDDTYACHFTLLGYRRNKDTKEIYIVPEEAETVKQIFQMYLQGRSLDQIKRYLEENNILTVRGNPVWDKGVIKSMLTNEKYVGDIMFQKTYREDCISKRTKINRGEMDR